MVRKPTEYVQFKLRVREGLRRNLEREAKKKAQSANNEAVERLEKSFEIDERISQLRDVWTERFEDLKKQSREAAEEATAALAELQGANLELERSYAQAEMAATMIDVLLGKNEASSNLLRRIALELANSPDWSSSRAGTEAMAERLRSVCIKGDAK
jgi:di/tripeptidase